jgi:hypothetical protein
MANEQDLEADLIIALQTLDTQTFKQLLQGTSVDMVRLQDQSHSNIFHELCKVSVRESLILEFFSLLTSFFYRRYAESAPENISYLLNTQTLVEKLTPLHMAVRSGKLVPSKQRLTKEFLRLGSRSDVKASSGQGLAHLACLSGSMQILAFLKYDVGIALNETDAEGLTALHLTAKAGHEHTSFALIAWGCKLNEQDARGNSPLHYAAACGAYRVVRALLLAGAEKHSKNQAGETAYSLAKACSYPSVAKLLVKNR